MSLALQRSLWFKEDFERQARWYARHATEGVPERYLAALDQTLNLLLQSPGLGRLRRFRHPRLRGIRSYRVAPPFNKHLIFYRYDADVLFAERVIHGARDLPRRLTQSPFD
jgi:plasmid stabilization system protein ParE